MAAKALKFVNKDDAGATVRSFYLPLNKLDATAAPTVTDDDTEGYVAGSLWVDRTNDLVYVCLDNGTGAAVWSNGTGYDVNEALISVVWGTPGAESGDAIEVGASCVNFSGGDFNNAFVDVEVMVTDGAADNEPSATATLAAAGTPVGTVLAGSGTATMVIRTDASGDFAVKVSETAAGNRYLWTKQGGNARLWVRSSTGVVELSFA